MESLLETFADRYHLRLKGDRCGDPFIPCQRGQIYEHGGGTFGAMAINDAGGKSSPKVWGNIRRALLAAGCIFHQNGDGEGTCLFDSEDPAQSRVAIMAMKARKKRQVKRIPENVERWARMGQAPKDKGAPGAAISTGLVLRPVA